MSWLIIPGAIAVALAIYLIAKRSVDRCPYDSLGCRPEQRCRQCWEDTKW